MKKSNRVYLQHIHDAVRWIGEYTDGMDRETFLASHLVQDAVVYPCKEISRYTSHDFPALWVRVDRPVLMPAGLSS